MAGLSLDRGSLPKSRSGAPGWQGATTGSTRRRSNASSRNAPPRGSVTGFCCGTLSTSLPGDLVHLHHPVR
jgi:hypothetical protein